MKISSFAVDKEKTENGTWVDLSEEAAVLVARMNNEQYNKYIRKHGKVLSMQARVGTINEQDAIRLTKKAVANTVLLGWRGITDDAGAEIPYSVDKAIELFEAFPEFFTTVMDYAQDKALFKLEAQEEARGNS